MQHEAGYILDGSHWKMMLILKPSLMVYRDNMHLRQRFNLSDGKIFCINSEYKYLNICAGCVFIHNIKYLKKLHMFLLYVIVCIINKMALPIFLVPSKYFFFKKVIY